MKLGVDEVADQSLKILCKSINSIPLFIKGTFMKCRLWFVSAIISKTTLVLECGNTTYYCLLIKYFYLPRAEPSVNTEELGSCFQW